jgi:hypothetical protein
MSDKHEATVEVLTAEVRLLQVGRRQVTLSVVRQLDWADPADVVPFGRVRTGDNLPGRPRAIDSMASSRVKQPAAVEVVGSASGVLVRSVSWHSSSPGNARPGRLSVGLAIPRNADASRVI